MSQINYNMQIIGYLITKPNHIRGLAKELKTNQTTISRKIYELYEHNVVDYHEEGKNKMFFLKKSLEAKEFVFMFEIYALLETIKKYPTLRRIIEQIQKNKKITVGVLFGSYAKGIANKDSDIDVYIDTEDKMLKEEIAVIDTKLQIKIGLYNKKNLLIKEIEKHHIIIKGVEIYYERNQFFE